MNMPKHVIFAIVASIVLCAMCSAYALWMVTKEGSWPKSWPEELDPLRSQSRSSFHATAAKHEIPFGNREEFEFAWPYILSIKSKEAPIILSSSPDTMFDLLFGETYTVGVRIWSPRTGMLVTPEGRSYPPGAESAIPNRKFLRIGPPWPDYIKSESGALPEYVAYVNGKWAPCTEEMREEFKKKRKDWDMGYGIRRARIDIELIVDGEIIDLNRIHLPPDTPIIDKRFEDTQNK